MDRRIFFKSALAGGGAVLLASRAYPLKFYPNPGKHKWAVLYGTRYGSNRDAAVWISEGMGAIADVFDARENPDLSSCEFLVIGSGIYNGKIAPPLEEYIRKNLTAISKKVKTVFTVCGAGGSDYGNSYLDQIAQICEATPLLKKSFPGRQTKKLLSAEDFKVLENYYQRTNQPFEDYDRVQRKDFLQFGEDILKKSI
ncbi:MAG: flavodoxin domain-containing protein [Candidatus Aminicenantales bacterium]